jgi:DNA gyrase/topoisomerase IV subunit B
LLPMFFEDGTEYTHSLVNAIPVFQGGTHIDAFKRCFFANMLTALERESKKRKLTPNRSDLIDGMLIFNITEMEAPTFDGQSKTRIVNEGIGSSIKTEMDDPEFFKKIMKSNPEWIEAVYARCAERTMKKDAIDISKLVKKGRTKVANLTDATSSDRSKCILMLTEGLSAAAGCITIRDPAIHGVLPLRGKVLNVYDQPLKTIIENEAISSIVRAIGLIPGQAARRGQLRYGKVYITVDADQDGANIACLLMLLFQKLWPDLFDSTKEPFLYMFQTPLLIAVKKNIRHYWFEDNIETFDPVKFQSFKITRAKGLGSLDQQSWGDCMKNPKLTAITEDGNLSETLAMIFDPKRADDRKDWMGI